MKRKPRTCLKGHCEELPVTLGYCQEHYKEKMALEKLRDDAVRALHTGIVDKEYFQEPSLLHDLDRIRHWWFQICDCVNASKLHPILKDETQYSVDWCIALAKELVKAERRAREGAAVSDFHLDAARKWVWERFGSVEQGLKSNTIRL